MIHLCHHHLLSFLEILSVHSRQRLHFQSLLLQNVQGWRVQDSVTWSDKCLLKWAFLAPLIFHITHLSFCQLVYLFLLLKTSIDCFYDLFWPIQLIFKTTLLPQVTTASAHFSWLIKRRRMTEGCFASRYRCWLNSFSCWLLLLLVLHVIQLLNHSWYWSYPFRIDYLVGILA